MASLSKDNQTIQFVDKDRTRRTLRLGRILGSRNGKVTAKAAQYIKVRVESLIVASVPEVPMPVELAKWVSEVKRDHTRLYDRLAALGLVPDREPVARTTLEAFIDDYIAQRTDVKPATEINYRQTRRCLIGHFGADKPLADITPADADNFRRWLASHEKLGKNTVRRRCGIARQFFLAAVRARLIEENPFGHMKDMGVKGDPARQYFVSRDEADKVLAACPDAEWRLLFALCRYGGLRCPSEVLTLRWSDVNWGANRITVHSPKTAHHEGGESRVMPLFPELRPYLNAVWDEAQERDEAVEFVITRYRQPNANLRTQLERIIKRAGLTPWPKLFNNLRATRATELDNECGSQKAATWLGHSEKIAAEHYRQVTDDDFEKAAQTPTGPMPKALHEPVQYPAATGGNGAKREEGDEAPKRDKPRETLVFSGFAEAQSVLPQGLEP